MAAAPADLAPVVVEVMGGVDPETVTMKAVRRKIEAKLGLSEKSIDTRKKEVEAAVRAFLEAKDAPTAPAPEAKAAASDTQV